MKKWFSENADAVIFGVLAVVFLLWMFYSEAQFPQPEDPMPWPYKQVVEDDEGCRKVVKVTEPSQVKTTCWKEVPVVMHENQKEALYMVLPAGCVAVIVKTTRTDIDVVQDKDCDIVIWNEYPAKKEEKEVGI